jgi:hypothetical protein
MGFTNVRSYVFERHLFQNSSSSSTLLCALLSDVIPEFDLHNILTVMMIQILRIVIGSLYVSWESDVRALFDLSSKFRGICRRKELRPSFGVRRC